MDFTPTPEQVEKGLTDKKEIVRLAWVSRKDFTPTPEQVERGLLDDSVQVCLAWIQRDDISWTHKQFQIGLQHPDENVREALEQALLRQKINIANFQEDVCVQEHAL